MKLLIKILSSEKALFLVCILLLTLAHHNWFSDLLLTGGDWGHGYKEWILEYLKPYYIWKSDNDLGSYNTAFNYNIVFFMQALLIKLGASFEISQRILVFWPLIFLPFIGVYLLFRYLYKDPRFACVGGLFASLAPRILMAKSGHLHQVWVYTAGIFALYFLIRAYKERRWSMGIFSGLSLSFGFFFEPRVGYIFLTLLISYLFFEFLYSVSLDSLKRIFLFTSVLGSILVFTNFFWIYPYFFEGGSSSVFSQAATTPWISRDRLVHGLFQTHPDWTGSSPTVFRDNTPLSYFFLLPLLAFLPIIFKRDKYSIFFSFIALLGIFFLKQENPPLGSIYTWLFDNFPLFNAFRESSKFNYVIVLAYAMLIPLGLQTLFEIVKEKFNKYVKVEEYQFLLAGILYVCLLGLPAFTGNMTFAFSGTPFISEYADLKAYQQESTKDFARQIWLPDRSRFTYFTSNLPVTAFFGIELFEQFKREEGMHGNFKNPMFYNLLEIFGYKYIVFTKDTISLEKYGYKDRLVSLIENNSFLHAYDRKSNFGDITVFETARSFPRFYLTDRLISFHGDKPDINKLLDFDIDPKLYSLSFDIDPAKADILVLSPQDTDVTKSIIKSYSKVELNPPPLANQVIDIPLEGIYSLYVDLDQTPGFSVLDPSGDIVQVFQTSGVYDIALEKQRYYISSIPNSSPKQVLVTEDMFEVVNGQKYATPSENDLVHIVYFMHGSSTVPSAVNVTIPNVDPYSEYEISFDASLVGSNESIKVLYSNDPKFGKARSLSETSTIYRSPELKTYSVKLYPQLTNDVLHIKFEMNTPSPKDSDYVLLGIANLTVTEIVKPKILFVKGVFDASHIALQPAVSENTPTNFSISVNGNQGYYLNFSDKYDSGWRLTSDDTHLEQSHFSNYALGNVWKLENDSSTFTLDYGPQKSAYLGWIVTAIFLALLSIVVVYTYVYETRRS